MTSPHEFIDTYTALWVGIALGVGLGWLMSSLTQPAPRWFGWVVFVAMIGMALFIKWWTPTLVVGQ